MKKSVSLGFILGALMGSPIVAEAAASFSPCVPVALAGRVRHVTTFEVNSPSIIEKSPRAEKKTAESDVSPDGRVVTATYYQRDATTPGMRERYPTLISQYDEKGLLTLSVSRDESGAESRRLACDYAPDGRPMRAVSTSANPEMNYSVTYEYGPDTRRSITRLAKATIVLTQKLDAQSRVIEETSFDEIQKLLRQTTRYSFEGAKEIACSHFGNGKEACVVTLKDEHGNAVEVSTAGAIRRYQYRYDSVGNMVFRQTSVARGQESRVEQVTRYQITYW